MGGGGACDGMQFRQPVGMGRCLKYIADILLSNWMLYSNELAVFTYFWFKSVVNLTLDEMLELMQTGRGGELEAERLCRATR